MSFQILQKIFFFHFYNIILSIGTLPDYDSEIMIIKGIHFSVKTAGILSIIAMLLAASFLTWVVIEPRSLSFVKPYVEKELNKISPDFKVEMDEGYIKWDGFKKAFSIYATNIRLLNDTHETLASFPEAHFDFSVLKFLQGQVLSSDVTLINPQFFINTQENKLYVTEDTAFTKEDFLKALNDKFRKSKFQLPVSSIKIKDADIFISNGASDMAWKIKDGYLSIDNLLGANRIISEFAVNTGSTEISINTEISTSENSDIDFQFTFDNLPSYIISDLMPDAELIKNVNLTAAGTINLLLSPEGTISQIIFDISKASGDVKIPQLFEKPLQLSGMTAKGNIYDNFSVLAIDELDADIKDAKVNLSGLIRNRGTFEEIAPDIDIDVKAEDIDVNNIGKYWPINIGEKTREWVTSNLTGGKISDLEGKFRFTYEDITKIKEWLNEVHASDSEIVPPQISQDAINGVINVSGTNVHYHEDYPDVNDVTAKVTFTSEKMEVNASKGKVGDSDLNSANLVIPNLWLRPLMINIEGEFLGKVKDINSFLKASLKNQEQNKILESIYNGTGDINGTFSYSSPIKHEISYDEIKIEIESILEKVEIPKIVNDKNLTDAKFDFSFKDNKINISGNGKLNNTPLNLDFYKDISRRENFDAKYVIKSTISPAELEELKIASLPFISDNLTLDVTVIESGDKKTFEGVADVKTAKISIPKIAFEKPSGVAGSIKFSAVQLPDSSIDITKLDITGDRFSANGNMKILPEKGEVSSLNFDKVKFAGNDLSVKYNKTSKGFQLNAQGKGLDLSSVSLGEFFSKPDKAKQSMDITADFKNLYMKNNVIIKDFSANVNCDTKLCSSVNAYGRMLPDKFVVVSMKPLGDRSSLMVESDNAGELIKALGISKHIEGGRLNVESTFADQGNTKIAKGIVRINKFVAVKTPLLGKMLTLASLKGIDDLLNNQGITFEKFEAPFTMSDGKIWVKDAKSSGSSLGITSEGTIDTAKGEIDLKGAIVPAYEVNKALGKIPLVGDLLVGNKNEGVLATTYKVKGDYEDAKISVNPLTILTPGFLRNIFEIFPD